MTKSILTRYIVRGLMIASLAVACHMAFPKVQAQDKAEPAPSQLARDMIGTWILVGRPGEEGPVPVSGGRLKFFTGKNWLITQADPITGVTIFHHGGTYTLDGDKYTETFAYANQNTADYIGKVYHFTVKVEGDTYTQVGIDNPFTEVWKRVK